MCSVRNMKRNTLCIILITIISIALIGVSIFVFEIINYYTVREALNPNRIELELEGNLDMEKVDVWWHSNFDKKYKIVESGRVMDKIYKQYGRNYFIVLYDNDTVGLFNYFKYNNWHGHNHIIKLKYSKSREIEISVKIDGPDIQSENYFEEKNIKKNH